MYVGKCILFLIPLISRCFFYSRKSSSCLNDEPQSQSIQYGPRLFYEKLPGEIYDGNEQCKMVYGKEYYLCPMRKVRAGTLLRFCSYFKLKF